MLIGPTTRCGAEKRFDGGGHHAYVGCLAPTGQQVAHLFGATQLVETALHQRQRLAQLGDLLDLVAG